MTSQYTLITQRHLAMHDMFSAETLAAYLVALCHGRQINAINVTNILKCNILTAEKTFKARYKKRYKTELKTLLT